HWHLAFPHVIGMGGQAELSSGFDVVLGNPPWDTLSPDLKEFFSTYSEEIRSSDKAGQQAIVAQLIEDVGVAEAWRRHRRHLFATARFIKKSGRYKLFAPGNLGKGDFNVYRMFAETAFAVCANNGFATQVLPANFYNGPNAMALRQELFQHWRLS